VQLYSKSKYHFTAARLLLSKDTFLLEDVSSNPVHGEVYSIQHYMIKFATGRWFSPGTPVSSTNKTDLHDITEVLLKVALNTINQ
jgi:hypothetical protein